MRYYGPATMFDTRRFEARHRIMKAGPLYKATYLIISFQLTLS